MADVLTKEAKEQVQNDPILFGQVCAKLDIKPISLPRMLDRNSTRLTEHSVLLLIAKTMKKKPADIIEDTKVLTHS